MLEQKDNTDKMRIMVREIINEANIVVDGRDIRKQVSGISGQTGRVRKRNKFK